MSYAEGGTHGFSREDAMMEEQEWRKRMNNKEAIETIKHIRDDFGITNKQFIEAYTLAIKVLEKMIAINNLMETYAVDSDEHILLENIQAILGGYENEDNPE